MCYAGAMRSLRAVAIVLTLATAAPVFARSARPPTVEIDGCVMPATACADVRGVVKVRVGDRKIELAVERVWLPGSAASGSKLLTELELRGLTVHGPKEVTGRLAPGAHVRVRGVLRTGPMMLVQSIEPRPAK
jgi:hypothetical protein